MMPWVIRVARVRRSLYVPGASRPVHSTLFRGVSAAGIIAAAVLAITLALELDDPLRVLALPSQTGSLRGMVIGAMIILFTGILDDLRGVSAGPKFVAQAAAALAVVAYGFRINSVSVGGESAIHLGLFSLPLTMLWVLGMTNVFKVIGAVDGIAGTLALIALSLCVGTDVLVYSAGAPVLMCGAVGAVFAALHYRRHPSRIGLCDSGVTLLGFFLSISLISASTSPMGATNAIVPLVAVAFLFSRSIAVSARRLLLRRGHRDRAGSRYNFLSVK
jgi:UDP-GlcNAc:undecaprenyl-phosphate GlcNAc-1-phosphate transferase